MVSNEKYSISHSNPAVRSGILSIISFDIFQWIIQQLILQSSNTFF